MPCSIKIARHFLLWSAWNLCTKVADPGLGLTVGQKLHKKNNNFLMLGSVKETFFLLQESKLSNTI